MNDHKNELELIEKWLLFSGIQDQSNEEIKHGGVYSGLIRLLILMLSSILK